MFEMMIADWITLDYSNYKSFDLLTTWLKSTTDARYDARRPLYSRFLGNCERNAHKKDGLCPE